MLESAWFVTKYSHLASTSTMPWSDTRCIMIQTALVLPLWCKWDCKTIFYLTSETTEWIDTPDINEMQCLKSLMLYSTNVFFCQRPQLTLYEIDPMDTWTYIYIYIYIYNYINIYIIRSNQPNDILSVRVTAWLALSTNSFQTTFRLLKERQCASACPFQCIFSTLTGMFYTLFW